MMSRDEFLRFNPQRLAVIAIPPRMSQGVAGPTQQATCQWRSNVCAVTLGALQMVLGDLQAAMRYSAMASRIGGFRVRVGPSHNKQQPWLFTATAELQ